MQETEGYHAERTLDAVLVFGAYTLFSVMGNMLKQNDFISGELATELSKVTKRGRKGDKNSDVSTVAIKSAHVYNVNIYQEVVIFPFSSAQEGGAIAASLLPAR